MDDLFGGSESRQTSKPVDVTPGAFKGLQGPLADFLKGALGGGFGGIPGPGQMGGGTSAGMMERATTETPEARAIREGLLAGGGPGFQQRQDLLNQTLGGNFLPGQQGSNPFLEAAITAAQRPTLQGLIETLERVLPGRFTRAGQFVQPEGSSAFDRAAAIATRGAADAISDIATNMSFGVYEGERGRQQEAVQLGQQEVETLISNYEAQLLPTFIAQFGIEAGLKEYQTRVGAMLDILRTVAGVSSPVIAQESKSTSESKPGIMGTLFPSTRPFPIPGA